MKTECVIFDMDGLIIDSERLTFDMMVDYARELGHEITRERYVELLGANYDYTVNCLEEMMPGVDGKDFLKEFTRRYVEAVERGEQRIKPGFFELSDELVRRGIKSAVASSNLEKLVLLNLRALGIIDRFDALVYDGMAARAKPFPDLFLKAAELTETDPSRCLVLEDSFAGIYAARDAGMRAIIVPDMREPTSEILSLCERSCESLLGVIDYLNETDET